MIIGRCDRRIVIEKRNATASSTTGERTYTWETLAVLWANVMYKNKGTENQEEGRETATKTVIFAVRYRADVTAQMRVKYLSKYYQITNTAPMGGRNDILYIYTEAKE